MKISFIAAVAKNGVVGDGNRLPWHLPEDLKRFKATTLGSPIVMGRKTFDSIGRVLPGRPNIIISRQPSLRIEGATVVGSLQQAIGAAEKVIGSSPRREIFVIGGGEIWRQALPMANRIYLTQIHAAYAGDAFFPEFDRSLFREISREDRLEPIPHSYLILEKA